MTLMLILGEFFCLYMASAYKLIAQNSLSDSTLTTAGALGAIFNGMSRPVWGILYDKFGFKKVYFGLLCIEMLAAFTI